MNNNQPSAGKFVVLNTVAAFVLALLYVAGYFESIIHGPVALAVAFLFGLVLTGLACIIRKRYETAHWICHQMTMFGLGGTVLGLINVFTHTNFSGDIHQLLSSVATGFGLALYSTFTGISGYLWLNWNLFTQGQVKFSDPEPPRDTYYDEEE